MWGKEGIDDIESKEKVELSASYRYRADMTPGEFEGEAYDGVIRDIRGNHVATVPEGRAGPDVLVADAKPPDFTGNGNTQTVSDGGFFIPEGDNPMSKKTSSIWNGSQNCRKPEGQSSRH